MNYIKMIELLNIDNMEFMAGLPDKAFDLAIVDPPYGIGENGDRNASRGKLAVAQDYKAFAGGDREAPPVEYFNELQRVSYNQIVWGANHFIDRIAKPSSCWVVWDKVTGNSDFADSELAWTSFKTAVRNFRFQWSGMLQGDMKNKEARIHPTQKPVKLYEWLLTNYAKPGQRILDTHGGSMSIAIACHNLGYDLTLCELDEDYYKAGVARFEQHKAQGSLFIPDTPRDAYEQTDFLASELGGA
jgi:site-specific DNA-methyltransferase (adenine-specific)